MHLLEAYLKGVRAGYELALQKDFTTSEPEQKDCGSSVKKVIKRKRRSFGRARKVQWTAEQDQAIKELSPFHSDIEVAQNTRVNSTEARVAVRRRDLGIKKQPFKKMLVEPVDPYEGLVRLGQDLNN